VFSNDVNPGSKEILLNFLILLCLISIIIAIYYFKKFRIIIISSILCIVSMVSISINDIRYINSEYQKIKSYRTDISEDNFEVTPLFNISSSGKNTLIIMLDRAVSVFFPYILEEDPELKDIYSGFIYYPNTVSYNGYTRIATPPLLGGYEYTPIEFNKRNNVSVRDKHNESLLLLPKLFSDKGFKITVLDPPYPNYSHKDDLQIFDPIENVNAFVTDSRYNKLWLNENNLSFASTKEILQRNFLWLSIFRISPPVLRKGLYLQGDWCSPSLMNKMLLTLNGYAVLDFLPHLAKITANEENTLLIMINNTTHEPSFMQAPEYRPVLSPTNFGTSIFRKETAYHVNISSIKRIGEWLKILKEHGAYDNSRIIIVSDHGPEPNFLIKSSLPFNIEQFNPLLLVKDFYAAGALSTDNTFMTTADVPLLALQDQIENPINPFTNNKIFNNLKSGPQYIAVSGSIHIGDPNGNIFILNSRNDYDVQDNIFNQNN